MGRGLPENIMIKSGLKIDEITGVKMHSNGILAKSGPQKMNRIIPLDHLSRLFHPFHLFHFVHRYRSVHSSLVAQGDPPQSSHPFHPFHLFLVYHLCNYWGRMVRWVGAQIGCPGCDAFKGKIIKNIRIYVFLVDGHLPFAKYLMQRPLPCGTTIVLI